MIIAVNFPVLAIGKKKPEREHRTGIAKVMGSNPVEALIFFRLLLSNCLNWKIYCDDHTSLSSTTAVQISIISYIFHLSFSNLTF